MRLRETSIALIVVVSMVGMAMAPVGAAQQADGEAYSGTHVAFDTTDDAVTNYAVDGEVIVENVTVQSASEARSSSGIGADAGLETATEFRGSGVETTSQSSASATVEVESGAEMEAHDNQRGILQLRANDESQMVNAKLGDDAEAESESDKRVVVERDDGSEGAFIVVGDGEVVVNEEGNVTAEVEQGSELVYRQYDGEREDSDEEAERMIENGTATAEVYVQQAGDDGEETTANAVEYGQDTTVEVSDQSRDTVEMTVERSQSEGKVVLTTVSEEAFDSAEDIEVFVDGEAAAQADSYSAVEQSATEGDQPRYFVAQSSSAEAATDVAIGIDHFSERNVQLTSGDGDAGGDGDSDGATDGDGAGFGVLAALAALGAALLATRQHL